MQYIYLKQQLENLSQGERISFVRQFRRMTQGEVSDKLGLDGENKRRSMARYESGDRKPKENRLLEIASILKVNPKIIKEYNFQNQEDLIYILLWMEEKYPRMSLDFNILEYLKEQNKFLLNFMDEWNDMRRKRLSHEITYEEYIESKFQYEVKEGETNERNS
ncbi:MAG: helix-turn-helix domain-containing protein [Bacilli bacterium]